MLVSLLVTAVCLTGTLAAALQPRVTRTTCVTPTKRLAWQDMPNEDKKAYLAAEQCVMRSPAKLNKIPGAKTRWDELVGLHQILALQIHSTGNFLPFHRYFLHAHEFLLNECGYTGGLPYWDEPRDAGNFTSSSVFDPILGFGRGGSGAKACVPDGPFANMTVNIGPGFTSTPRCVNRRVTNVISKYCGESQVATALNHTAYAEVWPAIYSGPHLTGHMALSMMNGDSITSPGDPLFMLHHGFVDKMWWDWQAQDPDNRLKDISGLNDQDPVVGFSEFPGGQEAESRMWGKPTAEMKAVTPDPQAGDDGPIMTLGHVLSSLGIIPDMTVADIMDTKGGYLCYAYV
ncbi:hypothetical protein F5Y15DRAFT_429071 [Xylariaceae sp. FL0016]|nr:hypothetical protein F5Y15DRAFT_429071 [Xylariaceae sp. FL0016]